MSLYQAEGQVVRKILVSVATITLYR